tara:strand:+ start:69 stop:605 length:537 start_codon:yes stop_codon:yes gene_type:complete
MADEGDVLTNLDNQPLGNGADNQPTAGFIAQYIKDLSVENPNAPGSFQWTDSPQLDLQFNIAVNNVSDEVSEVELKINASAVCESGQLYMVELLYAGLVGARNLPEEQAHMFMFAEAPRILFPFARRVMADATRDMGFQPLMIDPIDFNGLYIQRMQERQQEEGAASADMAGQAGGNA